jgi:hypothetical protein
MSENASGRVRQIAAFDQESDAIDDFDEGRGPRSSWAFPGETKQARRRESSIDSRASEGLIYC